MFQLRHYQKSAVEKGLKYLRCTDKKTDKPSIIVLPTGSGKSLVIAELVHGMPDKKVVIFQPSKEILMQNYRKLQSYGVRDVGIFSASAGSKEVGQYTYATIGSVMNQIDKFHGTDVVIMDEVHLLNPNAGQYLEFFKQIGVKKVLGLTATPYRLKSYADPFTGERFSKINLLTRTRPRFFSRFCHITNVKELIDEGFLCRPKYLALDDFDISKIRVNSTGADFDDRSLRRYLHDDFDITAKTISATIDCISKHNRKHILVFTKFVEEAEELSRRLMSMGISSTSISGETKPKERDGRLRSFMNGDVQVMCNVGVLTTGFDFPELDAVILARPTMSMSLYYQIIGRGLRIAPGKKDCIVMDLCGSFHRFGPVEDFKMQYEDKGFVVRGRNGVLTGVDMREMMR